MLNFLNSKTHKIIIATSLHQWTRTPRYYERYIEENEPEPQVQLYWEFNWHNIYGSGRLFHFSLISFNDTMPSLYSSLICTPCYIYYNIYSPSNVLEQSFFKRYSICISLLILIIMVLSPSALCFPTPWDSKGRNSS